MPDCVWTTWRHRRDISLGDVLVPFIEDLLNCPYVDSDPCNVSYHDDLRPEEWLGASIT